MRFLFIFISTFIFTLSFKAEASNIFWNTANDFTVYEYTVKNSYNKLSGILKVKVIIL